MKLYLSSYRVGEDRNALKRLVGRDGRAAIVFNALDGHGRDRLQHLERERSDIASLGFECSELDLRTYFGDFEGLRARLERIDLLWVVGGNTFVLARAMGEARFAEAIALPLRENRLVYAGYSAGACIVGQDLDGCHLMDESDLIPEGYPRHASSLALGWVPWRIVPHWRSDHDEASLAASAVEHLLAAGLPFQALRDGQAFVIDDERQYLA